MKVLLFYLSLLCWVQPGSKGNVYRISADSEVTVTGTSSLHIWTMKSVTMTGTADIKMSDEGDLSINEVIVQVPVRSLRSGLPAMDNDAHNSLFSERYPTVSFRMKDFEKIQGKKGKSVLEVSGELNIAGKTRLEKIVVEYRTDKNGNILIKGLKNIRLSDYNIIPPALLFETVKAGNEITLSFNLYLRQNSYL